MTRKPATVAPVMIVMRGRARLGTFVALGLGAALGFAPTASAQGPPPPQPPPPPPGFAPPPAQVAAPDAQPSPWFPPPAQAPPAGQATPPPPEEGVYQIQPDDEVAVQPPPQTVPPEIPPYEETMGREGALLMAMLAARPFATAVMANGADSSDDPTGIVAGHVGMRAHGTGITEDMILRMDLEAFIGASTEGVEGEGRVFMSLGLATEVDYGHFLMFRFGAGGAMMGNRVVDHQVADLPALELGYVHIGADGFIEVAPRVGMAVTRMGAFTSGEFEPDPVPAVGGRFLVGGESLWGTLDYELLTGERPMHLGLLTGCYAQKFALCVDGRLVSASLDFTGGRERVTAISGGLSFGLGISEVEH
jgi:hypothetical protein